jgi:hypothetical protein
MEALSLENVAQKEKVTVAGREITLPIHYRDAEAIMAFFPVPSTKAAELLPTKRFRLVEVFPGTSVLAVVAFEYRDTDVGPYNELGLCFPVLYNSRFPIPLVPLLLEKWYPGLGFYIHHLPVTTEIAWRAGLEIWGYPKFVAGITFEENATRRICRLEEAGKHILSLAIKKPDHQRQEKRNLITYSIREGEILKTVIPAQLKIGYTRLGGATLELGEHPVAQELRGLTISPRAIEVRYVPSMQSILPAACNRYKL